MASASTTSTNTALPTRTHTSPLLPKSDARGERIATALILLNTPLQHTPLLTKLWSLCDYKVCADGGANRLYRAVVSNKGDGCTTTANTNDEEMNMIPDAIVGDLDSLQDPVRTYYASRGTQICHMRDQNSNDLEKALHHVMDRHGYQRTLVHGAFGGRLDQEMANMQALYIMQHQHADDSNESSGGVSPKDAETDKELWLYGDETCALLLEPGKRHAIRLCGAADNSRDNPSVHLGEGPLCGIIPFGAPCDQLTLEGFRWNLQDASSQFGGLVSTSNQVVSDTVHITASSPVIFTAEVHCGVKEDDIV